MSAILPPKRKLRLPPSLAVLSVSSPSAASGSTTSSSSSCVSNDSTPSSFLLPPTLSPPLLPPRRSPLLALSVSALSLDTSGQASDRIIESNRNELLDAIHGITTTTSSGSGGSSTSPSTASSTSTTTTTTIGVTTTGTTTISPGKNGMGMVAGRPSLLPRLPSSPLVGKGDDVSSRSSTGISQERVMMKEEEQRRVREEEESSIEVSPAVLCDLGKLGEGASGEVRKVRHIPTGKLMAKKTIPTSPNPSIHRQHLRELAIMRKCSDPHIVRYYGAFLEDNDTTIGICMEYCEAGSLDTIYKKIKLMNGRTGEKVLGKIAESILSGLVYLHDRKIIHRDIKPSNVLATSRGEIKLCDFGVSGELVNSFAGTYVGTAFYLSPERMRSEPYTINSDVWSMALTVLEVALNRFPFPEEGDTLMSSPLELLQYLRKMDPPSLPDEPTLGIKYTSAFRSFIQLGLDKDPLTRPSPQRLIQHPWIKRSQARQPPPDLARWVATVWGWNEAK